MLYTDQIILVSDLSDKELHSFALKIGCSKDQFKSGILNRYILTKSQAEKAQIYGARYLERKPLIQIAYISKKLFNH